MLRMNPFAILGVTELSSDHEAKKAFRSLAMKWHPDKNHENPELAKEKFLQIHEAYEILSDPKRRKIYLRQEENLPARAPYRASSANAYQNYFDSIYGANRCSTKIHENKERGIRDEPGNNPNDIVINFECTLEEIYRCHSKSFKITRFVDGSHYVKTVNVTLTPNIENNKKIVIPKFGHKDVDEEPGDLIIFIREIPHSLYKREEADIIANITYNSFELERGFRTQFMGIDSEPILVETDHFEQQETIIRIVGKGMKREDGTRGDAVFKLHYASGNVTKA